MAPVSIIHEEFKRVLKQEKDVAEMDEEQQIPAMLAKLCGVPSLSKAMICLYCAGVNDGATEVESSLLAL